MKIIKNTIPQHQAMVLQKIKSLPKKLAVEANEFFEESFINQGFTDSSYERWQNRKTIVKNNTAYDAGKNGLVRLTKKGNLYSPLKSASNRRGILMLSGDLRRSLKNTVVGNQVAVYSNLPYAKFHNEGGKKMPKRQFMGNSQQLNNKLLKIINEELKSI